MKRSAFTMIELVFIIVILGILGAIAVPKMAASRLDAKIVAIRTDLGTIMQAIPAMAMSQGIENVTKISDALTLNPENWKSKESSIALADATVIYSNLDGNGKSGAAAGSSPCVSILLKDSAKPNNLWIIVNDDGICPRIMKNGTYEIELLGKSVEWNQ